MKKLKVVAFYSLILCSFLALQMQAADRKVGSKKRSQHLISCIICPYKSFYASTIDKHESYHFCGQSNHRNRRFNLEKNQCQKCYKILATCRTFKDHVKWCVEEAQLFKCALEGCSVAYSSMSSLNTHWFTKHHSFWQERQLERGGSLLRKKRTYRAAGQPTIKEEDIYFQEPRVDAVPAKLPGEASLAFDLLVLDSLWDEYVDELDGNATSSD